LKHEDNNKEFVENCPLVVLASTEDLILEAQALSSPRVIKSLKQKEDEPKKVQLVGHLKYKD